MSYEDFASFGFYTLIALQLLSWALYFLLGLTTVRKLRRNPATRDALGIPIFITGGETGNVAQACGCPVFLLRISARGPLRVLDADRELVFRHTTRLDRALGFCCFWSWFALGVVMITVCTVYAIHERGSGQTGEGPSSVELHVPGPSS